MTISSYRIVFFVHDDFHGKLPNSFNNIFNEVNKTCTLFTKNANDGKLTLPTSNSTKYGLKSIYKLCIDNWNSLTSEFKKIDINKLNDTNHVALDLHNVTRSKLKQLITEFFLDSYGYRSMKFHCAKLWNDRYCY